MTGTAPPRSSLPALARIGPIAAWIVAAAACSASAPGPGDRPAPGTTTATTTVPDASGPGPVVPDEPVMLVVFVRVRADGAEILEVNGAPDRRNRPRGSLPPMQYRLDLLDAGGNVLASTPFDAPLETRAALEGPDGGTLHVRVPSEETETAVRIDDAEGGATLRVVRIDGPDERTLATRGLP